MRRKIPKISRTLKILIVLNVIVWSANHWVDNVNAAEPVVVPNLNNEVISHGIQAARDYAAAHGWEDHCAGQPINAMTFSNADEMAGGKNIDGFANMNCSFVIDAEVQSLVRLCQVAEHEALHEIRHDDWHDPDQTQPLAESSPTVGPECAVYAPQPPAMAPVEVEQTFPEENFVPFSYHTGRQAVRKRLNKRWKIKLNWVAATDKGMTGMEFYAYRVVRHKKREKVFLVERKADGKVHATEMVGEKVN